jgi:hypothetical protein
MSVSQKVIPGEVKPVKSVRYEEAFKRDAVRLVTEEPAPTWPPTGWSSTR